MPDSDLYLVRDAQGNIYGPAPLAVLRQWVHENRIAAGMEIAPQGSDAWQLAGTHPALVDLFGAATPSAEATPGAPAAAPAQPPAATPNPYANIATDPYAGSYSYGATHNPWAVAALICGIVGLLPICGAIGAVAALVCGIVGLSTIKANPQRYTGRGMAIAGIALGAVGLLECCTLSLLYISFLGHMGAGGMGGHGLMRTGH